MARDNMVLDLLDTPTTQGAPLGAIYIEPSSFWQRDEDTAGVGAATVDQGEREFVYVRVVTDTPAQGLVIRRANGLETFNSCRLVDIAVAGPAIASVRIPGICQWAATAGDFMWVMRRGMGAVQSDGNSTVDLPFISVNDVAAGNIRDVTATTEESILGVALDEDGGAAILVNGWIYCLGA